MNSSDLRLVRLIPVTGEGSFSRASDATYFDAAGVLQTAPPNTLRVTYDPADLSKAPYALVELEARNFIRNNTMQGAVVGVIGAGGIVPTNWSISANNSGSTGLSAEITSIGVFDGINYIDVKFSGTPSLNSTIRVQFDSDRPQVVYGEAFALSPFVRMVAGILPGDIDFFWDEFNSSSAVIAGGVTPFSPNGNTTRGSRIGLTYTPVQVDAATIRPYMRVTVRAGVQIDFAMRIGLPQLERRKVTSPIKTSNGAVTRAADVVGPGAGLVYSNVPITEPLWVSGTYALGARVRDAAFLTYESQVANNTAALTDKTKWLPLGATNQRKAFDKAVNSQTTAAGLLAFALKPGVVATTLMLLNMEGASVTVSQSDSGYVKTQSLVSHEVDNWYDFYYEEPVRAGDAVFTDIPPYPNSMLTVAIDNGPLEAKIGACLVGKPLTLGKVTASFSAGVLSYSTSTTDTFGNITMVKRSNAPRMNFEVMIPTGSEDFAYRTLRDITDTEIGIIVGDRFSMGIGYGFLGQWDVPKSGSGRTASIEFKGLV